MPDLQTRFEQAARDIQLLPERPDNETLPRLYKQGAAGDIRGPKPGFFDLVGSAKHAAWAKLAGTTRDEAKQRHVELVQKPGA